MKAKNLFMAFWIFLCSCSLLFANNSPFFTAEISNKLLFDDTKSSPNYHLSSPPPPAHDVCTGAVDFGVLVCDFFVQVFDDDEATPDPEATGNCVGPVENGLWYTFSTPDPMPFSQLFFNGSWTQVEIFKTDTDCSALTYVGCTTNISPFEIEPGTKYYILSVGGFVMTTPVITGNSCEDDLWVIPFDISNPYVGWGATECGQPSPMVPCENEHVYWVQYESGCNLSDLTIEVSEFTGMWHLSAQEVSISVYLDDCVNLATDYDVSGLGYVCYGISGSEVMSLEDIPPNTTLEIAFGSDNHNIGFFDFVMEEITDGDDIPNDECQGVEVVFQGVNVGLTNLCSSWSSGTEDPFISGCTDQSDATVWYTFDPGPNPQDIQINILSAGISNPAIAVYEDCNATLIGNSCTENIEVLCVTGPINIQIGSSDDDAGEFELEIITTSSGGEVEVEVMGQNICSNDPADIFINIPNGEFVNIEVSVAPGSSPFISGTNGHNFLGVTSATIEDVLFNSSNTIQEAIYIITISPLTNSCGVEPIEYSISVSAGFSTNSIVIDECLPHELNLDISDLITDGTGPYSTISWYWDATNLIGSGEMLSYPLTESGEITVEVVDAVGCEASVTITVDVMEAATPTFDFPLDYCRSDQDFIYFPNSSLESIPGSWNPTEINVETSADGFYEVLFTPNDQECNLSQTFTIQIYSGYEPVFDLPYLICSEDDEYVFPTVDQNGTSGYWENPTIDLSNTSGVQSNVFTPNTADCSTTFEYVFEISEELEMTFGEPDSLCTNEAPILLSDLSEQGYLGTWSISTIDPSQITEDSITVTWIPTDGQSPCLGETEITIQLIEPTNPAFSLPTQLCTSDTIFTFPVMDDLSVSGSWSIPSLDPSLLTGEVESVFTPDDNCIESFTWEISILEPLIPLFSLDTSLCSLDSILTLPTSSDNAINGTWSPATLNPSTNGGTSVSIDFFGEASDTCVQTVTVIFEIEAAVVPTFNFSDTLCWLDPDIALPSNSQNGIIGTWEPAMIEVESNQGQVISSTFTPADGSCAVMESHSFTILAPYAVDLSLTDPSGCMVDDGSITIDNGNIADLEYSIDGGNTWQSDTDFTALSSGGYTILIRSTMSPTCIHEEEAFLNSVDAPIINEVNSNDIGDCLVFDGSILVDAAGNNLEFSIDGGLTWQSSNTFDNLPPGQYEISIRENMGDCIVFASATIEDIIQTEVISVNTVDITDCNADDGQIEILANGESLEYSIDNGVTWSNQNIFNNLPAGDYDILVQSTTGANCEVMSFAVLAAPDMPEIVEIMIANPTPCSPDIGSIEVDANGSNLEYSFDGGLTWQNMNMIPNAAAGMYTVIVRDADRIQCFVEELVTIDEDPENLEESTFEITLPTDCDLADGGFDVMNTESDVEFSIDGGATWQNVPQFTNLPSGMYTILTRLILLPGCNVEQSLEIPEVDCNCHDLIVEFELDNIPCGDEETASIDLTSIVGPDNMDVEIIWEDGTSGAKISEIGEGWYSYTINYDEHCIWEDSVFVEMLIPITFDVLVDDTDCPGLADGTIEIVDVSGGSGLYQYSIDDINYQVENTFSGLSAGIYEVYIIDDSNCKTIEMAEIVAPEDIDIDLPEIESLANGGSVILDPSLDVMMIDSFNWSPTVGIINASEASIEVQPEITTVYTLEIFYNGNCYDSKSVTVEVEEVETGIYFGNVFSPNGDSFNDFFYIQGRIRSNMTLLNMTVYDRWGGKIFTKDNPQINSPSDGWDGTYNGSKLDPAVFVYMVTYSEDGIVQSLFGTVTLTE